MRRQQLKRLPLPWPGLLWGLGDTEVPLPGILSLSFLVVGEWLELGLQCPRSLAISWAPGNGGFSPSGLSSIRLWQSGRLHIALPVVLSDSGHTLLQPLEVAGVSLV